MIAVIDYGMGNLYSVKNALDFLGTESEITSDAAQLKNADGLILPGVGAFPDAMETLEKNGLSDVIKKLAADGKPLLGICLGMQLLLDESEEVRSCRGLSLIGGKCIKINAPGLKIPHMGWNDLSFSDADCPLLKGIAAGTYVYFVHSYRAVLADESTLSAYTLYGEKIPAVIRKGNVFGVQFHPEKSEKAGLKMLSNFAEYAMELKRRNIK